MSTILCFSLSLSLVSASLFFSFLLPLAISELCISLAEYSKRPRDQSKQINTFIALGWWSLLSGFWFLLFCLFVFIFYFSIFSQPLGYFNSFSSSELWVCVQVLHLVFFFLVRAVHSFISPLCHWALNSGLAPIDWHKSLDKKDILIENELQRLRNRLQCHTKSVRVYLLHTESENCGTEKHT